MISEHTPPGARVRCINEVVTAPSHVDMESSIIRVGEVYTVAQIGEDPLMESRFFAELQEHPGYGYDISRFVRVTDIEDLRRIARRVERPLEVACYARGH